MRLLQVERAYNLAGWACPAVLRQGAGSLARRLLCHAQGLQPLIQLAIGLFIDTRE